ncbi:MAG: amino acid ABC transporter substrate-binding protein [FCB group bacterium]|nr:amino acid ABC transporter substrate-binding protein [FCB group bacterium]
MKRSSVLLAIVVIVCTYFLSANVNAQTHSASKSDTLSYAKTPWEYLPYNRFKNPYKRFFLKTLEYTGYGRHIPEPEHIDTVKIGFIGPIIGSVYESTEGQEDIELKVNQRVIRWDGYQASHLASIGIKMLQGAKLAVEQANAKGGYRGKAPYKLIVRNDNGNWRSSGREVIMLAYKDSVWAILGTVDGANSHIAIRVAFKAEIPVVNTANTDPTFVETRIPWVLRGITDDRQMCYLLADFAFEKLGLKRIAALRATNRYGRMGIDELRDAATRLGHPFMVELQYEEGDTDFSDQLKRIQSMNADGVITYGNTKESTLILKQMRKMGLNQWFFGSDRMVTKEFLASVGKTGGHVAAGYPYDPSRKDAKYLQFIDNFQNRYGEAPETYAAHAYDGMNMIIAAIEKAGLNRALIRDQLVSMSHYKGVTGIKELDAVFSNRSPATLAILKDGKFEFYSRKKIFSDKFNFEN